jgi:flagellar operon protein
MVVPGLAREFADVLDARLGEGLRFSKHAEARLASRAIPLSGAQRDRLAAAADEAGRRGAREALLLMGGMGFIVSVPNRTVITALDGSRMEAGVITGIDAAVVVPDGGE